MQALNVWRVAACFGMALAASPASAVLITFDDLTGMGNAPGTAVPVASQLSDQYLSSGVRFGSGSAFVAVVNLTSSGANHAITNPNGIGGVSEGTLSYATPIEMSFFDVLTGDVGVTDAVSIRGDQIAIAGTATLTAFGLDGSLLGSVTANDVNGGLTLSLALAGIHRVTLSETSATIAFDNFFFNTPVGPVRVPEPSSVLLLGIGVLGLLGARRRR